jgi:hypothetical protein
MLRVYIAMVSHHVGLTLRDVEKVATLAMVTCGPGLKEPAAHDLWLGTLVLQVVAPQLVDQARQGRLSFSDLAQVFDFGKPTDTDIRAVWTLVTENSSDFVASQEIRGQRKRLFGDRSPPLVLQLVIAETLDVFEMST